MVKKIISVFAIIILLFAYTNMSVNAATQSDVDKLNQQKKEVQNQLNNIKNEKNDASSELETINKQVYDLQSEISDLETKLLSLNNSISKKEEEIKQKQEELLQKEELLKKRLVTLYKGGGISYLDVLLGSNNYIEMLSKFSAVNRIAEKDTELITQVSEQKTVIENQKTELENNKTEVETAKKAKDAKNAELRAAQVAKQSKVAALTQEEKEKQNEIDKYNASIAKAEKEIQEAFIRAQNQINNSGIKFDGSFVWPCNNKVVTSRVKYRWGRMHKGIDIGANYENVYASASGYAYNLSNPGGYGVYIIVFHGSGYATLYGHLNYSKVPNGSFVSQGQVIAQSGNSGGSIGAHLHFEIRRATSVGTFFSSNAEDPLNYLPGGYTFAPGA